jgi:hypothetical protein
MPGVEIPSEPFVALYGSNSGDWREQVATALRHASVAFFDPLEPRWASIDTANGDAMQALVDELVDREHRALEQARCAIFHVARAVVVKGEATGDTVAALASRVELGFLAGRGIAAFVHVEPDVEGRNYLWAVCRRYPHLERCDSLVAATDAAIRAMRTDG